MKFERKQLALRRPSLFVREATPATPRHHIHHPREPPEEGIMCDALWADPSPLPGRTASKRGVGLSFGRDVTRTFLDANGLDLVVRSHEVKEEGYEVCVIVCVIVCVYVCVFAGGGGVG